MNIPDELFFFFFSLSTSLAAVINLHHPRFYQMKVITFLAAHHGLLELAEDMITGGVRADEPVGTIIHIYIIP